jgi:hypothetical protein
MKQTGTVTFKEEREDEKYDLKNQSDYIKDLPIRSIHDKTQVKKKKPTIE